MKIQYLKIFISIIIITSQLIVSVNSLKAEEGHDSKEVSGITSGQKPAIFFANPNFDFGKIYVGRKAEHVFKFENKGESVLKISKIKTTCGCTAAILTNDLIQPGETGDIKATFKSGNYGGKVTKSITVLSNDPNSPKCILTISGEIIQELNIKPRNINFGPVDLGKSVVKFITIKSQTESSFKINKITPYNKYVDVLITEHNNERYVVKVTLKDNLKIGRFSGSIHLETDSQKQPKVQVPFFGEINGDLTAYPRIIYYGRVNKGKELSRKVFVKINNDGIRILNIKTTPDFLDTEITERLEMNSPNYLLEIKLTKEANIGKLKGVLELYTNSKLQPVIKIPIKGEIG